MMRIPPWTKLSCTTCGVPYQATMNTAILVHATHPQRCPACEEERARQSEGEAVTLAGASDEELIAELVRRARQGPLS